ncbi:MAG: LysM peptidoglycan-binding domain-containing protein, partial [Bacteroidales bacterium]|nr:LysM peptidoglycan-binding domain-containing protein [Bacteroidales bacterium]
SSSSQNTSSGTVYTVKSGDNLIKIAKKYGVTVDYIKKKNNLKSDSLKVGQKLKL